MKMYLLFVLLFFCNAQCLFCVNYSCPSLMFLRNKINNFFVIAFVLIYNFEMVGMLSVDIFC